MSQTAEYRIRKLDRTEHTRTRALWESVFIEDTAAFLDYYYEEKTKDNVIYVAQQDEKICAMLHLNPYRIMANGQEIQSFYIVAVATLPEHRHQGLMRRLLVNSLQEMNHRGVPFTFLMPAKEEIYLPFGFRFFYRQSCITVQGRGKKEHMQEVLCADVTMCKDIADFAEELLKKKYQIYTKRTAAYYERILKEQKSQNGGIYCLKQNGVMKGVFCYAKETILEFREPLCYENEKSAVEMLAKEGETVKISGIPEEEKKKEFQDRPLIMGRITCVERFLSLLRSKEDFHMEIGFKDALVKANEGWYEVEGRCGRLYAKRIGDLQKTCCDTLSVELFFSAVTGYLDVEEIEKKERKNMTKKGKELLSKLFILGPSFLNEVA